jgi:hypothetical protein
MAFTFDPSTAYSRVAQYLPGSKDATLRHKILGGDADPPSHNGKARYRTKNNSEFRRFASAFEASIKTAAWDWFAEESDSVIAKVGDVLEVDDEQWVVGQVGPGRWGSQQLLYCVEAVENG